MVTILNNIYTVKIYKWPVCMVEDILHLEMVIGLVDANYLLSFKKEKLEYKIKLLTSYLKKYNGIKVFLEILQLNSQSDHSKQNDR